MHPLPKYSVQFKTQKYSKDMACMTEVQSIVTRMVVGQQRKLCKKTSGSGIDKVDGALYGPLRL